VKASTCTSRPRPSTPTISTNDNLHALLFYQKRSFTLVTVHRHAVDAARQLKPRIPLIGNDQIPLHDEIELEMIHVTVS
jgi:hypothetical protein